MRDATKTPHVIVFLKAPRPGQVKTRLAQAIGNDAALHAYRSLVQATLRAIAAFDDVSLQFTPDDAKPEMLSWLGGHWQFAPQGNGDLGERMNRAFTETFSQFRQKVVMIGSDCPYLTATDILDAAQALDRHDVVLGPATDGGYWLIGLSRPQPILFEEVQWSTSTVLEASLRRAASRGLSVHLLRTLSDVDTPQDWQRYLDSKPARQS